MTARISKWGNSAAIRLPKEIMDYLALHVGDSVQIVEKNNAITISLIDEKKEHLIAEAKRIKESARSEYAFMDDSLNDGLTDV